MTTQGWWEGRSESPCLGHDDLTGGPRGPTQGRACIATHWPAAWACPPAHGGSRPRHPRLLHSAACGLFFQVQLQHRTGNGMIMRTGHLLPMR